MKNQVKDFQTAKWVLSDSEHFGPPSMHAYISRLQQESGKDFSLLLKLFESFLPFIDGQEHHRIRRLVNRLFTKKAVQKWIPVIQSTTTLRLEALKGMESPDLIVDVTDAFYMDLLEHLFGLQIPNRIQFMQQIEVAINVTERMASISQLKTLQKTLSDLYQMVLGQIEHFKPSTIFHEIVHELSDQMEEKDLVTTLIVLIIAPRATNETLAHIVMRFSSLTPAQHKSLSSKEWVAAHIEDLVRLCASTNLISREVKKEAEIHGCPFSQGEQVMVNIPAVGRDHSIYGDQVKLEDLDEQVKQRKILTFGAGNHVCLGMELSKEVIKVFIPQLFQQYPSLTCDHSKIEYYQAKIATRIRRLPFQINR